MPAPTQKPCYSSDGSGSSSAADLLTDSMQGLSIGRSRSTSQAASQVPSSEAAHPVSSRGTSLSSLSTPSSGSTGALFSPGLLALRSQARQRSSGTSSPGSESSSQLLMAFFSESEDSAPASDLSSLDGRSYKLALWQAILVTVGVCESEEGIVMPGLKRPAHFPRPALPLPTSLNACRALIKEYVFLNIVNFKQSQIDNEPLRLFPNATQLRKYTVRQHRFVKLKKAKAELLNPLLRTVLF